MILVFSFVNLMPKSKRVKIHRALEIIQISDSSQYSLYHCIVLKLMKLLRRYK